MVDANDRLTLAEQRACAVGPGIHRHPECGCLLALPTWRQRLGEWTGRWVARWLERGFGYGRFRNGLAAGINLNRGISYSSCGVEHG